MKYKANSTFSCLLGERNPSPHVPESEPGSVGERGSKTQRRLDSLKFPPVVANSPAYPGSSHWGVWSNGRGRSECHLLVMLFTHLVTTGWILLGKTFCALGLSLCLSCARHFSEDKGAATSVGGVEWPRFLVQFDHAHICMVESEEGGYKSCLLFVFTTGVLSRASTGIFVAIPVEYRHPMPCLTAFHTAVREC